MGKIAILVVDDHAVVRQGLGALLRAEPDMEVVGEAENGREALVLAPRLRPSVVVMDMAMPLLNGAETTRRLLKELPSVKVLVLSSYTDDECLAQMMNAGAAGFLTKETAAGELLEAHTPGASGQRLL